MRSEMIWANFVVKDAKRTSEFYNKLGFTPNKTPGGADLKLASFKFSDNNFVIHFFQQGSSIDQYLSAGTGSEIIFTISAHSEQEVKDFAEKVKSAGGTIFQKLERDAAGYYGFGFADPDGHKFNVLLMDNM